MSHQPAPEPPVADEQLSLEHQSAADSFLQRSMAGMEESFVILPKLLQTVDPSICNTTANVALENHLLQIVSEESQVDQPVCEDCVSRVLLELDQRYKDALQQEKHYQKSLLELEQRPLEPTDDEAFQLEIEQFEQTELELRAQLQELSEERSSLNAELEVVRETTAAVEEQEYRYWRDLNEYLIEYERFVDQKDSLAQRIEVTQTKLQDLQRTDIFDECFHIALADQRNCFGTINGFRMGTTSQIKVPWNEINAAWGQAALLLFTLAKQCAFHFSTYDIVPKGSFSYMLRQSDKYHCELHAQGNRFSLVANRRYDKGMQFFTENLTEMCTWMARNDPHFRLPLRMEADKIGGKSIKFQFNSDDAWTEGMAALLVNLQYLSQALTHPVVDTTHHTNEVVI